MDEIRIESLVLREKLANEAKKALCKSYDLQRESVELQIEKVHARIEKGNASVFTDLSAEINKDDFKKIITKVIHCGKDSFLCSFVSEILKGFVNCKVVLELVAKALSIAMGMKVIVEPHEVHLKENGERIDLQLKADIKISGSNFDEEKLYAKILGMVTKSK